MRPLYEGLVRILGRRGLQRRINGTDAIRVIPQLRQTPEAYEPEVWGSLMAEVRPGDIVADVGAHYGLYTVAIAQRVGPAGRVVAFEPQPDNFRVLGEQVRLNAVTDRVQPENLALAAEAGEMFFDDRNEQSHLALDAGSGTRRVPVSTLDRVFPDAALDLLKIDVEGFEEWVLRGAVRLLADRARRPRTIFIEVHPYAWPPLGTTSDSLVRLLEAAGYEVRAPAGTLALPILRYGHVVASDRNPPPSGARR